MIKAGIIGATGYAGAELVRLLMQHPQAEIAAISSVSFEGKPVSSVYPAYRRLNDMVCTTAQDVIDKSDVVFAALPHGLSQDIAKECYEREKSLSTLARTSGWKTRTTIRNGTAGSIRTRSCTGIPCTRCRSCSATR